MAIKGKSKSKSRGSRPKRRTAPPTRPVARATQKIPWYRTMRGQLSLIIGVLAVIGVALWFVGQRNADNARLEKKQEALKEFTGQVAPLVDSIQDTVREMAGAPFNTANPESIVSLKESTKQWGDDLELAGAQVQGLVAPDGLQPMTQMIQSAFLIYRSAALTYRLVPGEENVKRQQKLIERATDQRDQAARVLVSGLGLLDDARDKVELDASGIQPPSSLAPILPTPAPSPSDKDGGRKAGGDKKKGTNDGTGDQGKGDE